MIARSTTTMCHVHSRETEGGHAQEIHAGLTQGFEMRFAAPKTQLGDVIHPETSLCKQHQMLESSSGAEPGFYRPSESSRVALPKGPHLAGHHPIRRMWPYSKVLQSNANLPGQPRSAGLLCSAELGKGSVPMRFWQGGGNLCTAHGPVSVANLSGNGCASVPSQMKKPQAPWLADMSRARTCTPPASEIVRTGDECSGKSDMSIWPV